MNIKNIFKLKPRPPFNIRIYYNLLINIRKETKGLIEDHASWQVDPSAFHPGRSAHLSLGKTPIIYKHDNREFIIRALKLKGIGNFKEDKIEPPRPREYKGPLFPGTKQGSIFYIRPNEKGEIFPVWERSETPLFWGALSAENAKKEYELTKEGLSKGLPFNIPICWGSYKDLKFRGQTMGFVVLGLRDRLDRRFGDLTQAKFYKDQNIIHLNDYLHNLVPIEKGKIAKERESLNLFQDLFSDLGKALRSFHNAGFLRFSAHSGNYSVDEDSKEVILADLDTIIIKSEINPTIIFLSQLFDVVCAIRGIHELSFHTAVGILYFQTQKRNPYLPFLKGYFNEFSYKGKEKLLQISKGLWEKTIGDFKEGYERYFLNRHIMDLFASPLLFEPMETIMAKENIKPPYSTEALMQELKNYNQRVLELSSSTQK